ncbi:MAG: long-chain fatty acid--CoA ligase [Alphaproteobacteria bacterium]|nr:long-chain fatty acid--CoA ligase [Alphaproteobacteria bacterium]
MSSYFWERSYPPGVRWEVEVPHKPVHALIDEAAQRWPKQPFLDFLDKKLSYGDVHDLVDRAAQGFRRLGVKPGGKVALFLPNTPHYVIAFFGILKAGGVVVNMSPLDAERELAFKLNDSGAEIVVTLDLAVLYPRMAKLLSGTKLKTIVVGGVQDFLPFPKNLLFPLARRKNIATVPDDARHVRFKSLLANDGRGEAHRVADPRSEICVLQYTGGTTGEPKGAMLTHYNLVAAVTQMHSFFGQGEQPLVANHERVMGVLPLFHIYALTVVMLLSMVGGSSIVLHPRFELDAVLRDLHKKRPTMLPGVPTMYTAILNHPKLKEYDLSSLKFCNSGGAPLPPEVQQRFQELTGCKLLEGWGMTETSPAGTGTPPHRSAKPGSCGVPLPGIVIEFVDVADGSKLLPYGETGEICLRGPNVMQGYWQRPDATASTLANGRLHTGDIGYMDADGYLFIVDRKKDMILSGGYNVYPRNIEDAIYQHPAVSEVTVIGVPDEYRGQSAKAFIKLRSGEKPFNLDELRGFLADKLGKHELPAELEIRDELPKTVVGKLSKKELVEEEMRKRQRASA